MIEGTGPDAELFHVVAHGGHLLRVGTGGFLEIGDDLLDGAERNEVAKGFLAGDDPNGLTVIFSNVIGEQLLRLEARGEEMNIVENGVSNVGLREDGGELRLPDTLGEPGTGGALAEVMLDIIG